MAKMRVWHIPQVPGKAFHVPVDSLDEAIKILNVLSNYDLFQYENHIKPDYCNTNGLQVWDEDAREWFEWESEDGLNIREYEEET